MSVMLILVECSVPVFTLPSIVRKVTSMYMEWEEELDVHHIKINHVTSAQGKDNRTNVEVDVNNQFIVFYVK